MTVKTITISNEINMNNVGHFVQLVSRYESNILIQGDNYKIDAKSILGLLAMALERGREVTIITEGSDNQAAISAVCDFLAEKEYIND